MRASLHGRSLIALHESGNGPQAELVECSLLHRRIQRAQSGLPIDESTTSFSRRGARHGAGGPALRNQSAISPPVQNSTSFFLRIFSKIARKYFARCGAPMM